MEELSPRVDFSPLPADLEFDCTAIPGEPVAEASNQKRFRTFSAAELDRGDFSIRYLIDDLLVRGQPAILAAPSKSLKTTLALDLAISIASGLKFMDELAVDEASPVVMMTGESGLGTVQETCRRIARSKGIDLASLSGLTISDEVPRLLAPGHTQGVERLLDETNASVLICDPVYLMVDGSLANNLFVMGQQLVALSELCLPRNVTLVLLHHTSKKRQSGGQYSPLTLADISWSGFAEFVRQWLLVNRRSAYAYGTGVHRMWMVAGGSAGHSGLWKIDVDEGPNTAAEGRHYRISVQANDGNQSNSREKGSSSVQRAHEASRKRVHAVLSALSPATSVDSGLCRHAISRHCGLNPPNLEFVLQELIANGQAQVGSKSISGRKRQVYWIPSREEPREPSRTGDRQGSTEQSGNSNASPPLESTADHPRSTITEQGDWSDGNVD